MKQNSTSTLRLHFLALSACALTLAGAAAAPDESSASGKEAAAFYARISASGPVKKNPEVHVALDPASQAVTLSYHTRKWLVYDSNMTGEWSEKPMEETGPRADGFMITVHFEPKEEASRGQWAGRDSGLHLEAILDRDRQGEKRSLLRHPYWTEYGGSIEIPQAALVAQINISFNNRPNKELLTQFADELKSALKK